MRYSHAGLLRGGSLARRRASIDLLADDLDLGVLNVGSLDSDKGEPVRVWVRLCWDIALSPDRRLVRCACLATSVQQAFNFDDIPFNPNIAGHEPQKSRADSFSDVFGSSFGLGGGSFGGHSLGISLGKSAQRGTSSSSQAAAAAAAASAFPFGTSPPETSYADEMLDPDVRSVCRRTRCVLLVVVPRLSLTHTRWRRVAVAAPCRRLGSASLA